MLKLSAQEGLKKWFDVWEDEIREDWYLTEYNGGWNSYENFYRDWQQNYKEWCVMGDWEQVDNFNDEFRKHLGLHTL